MRYRPSSADAFPPFVRIRIVVTLDRIEARWSHLVAHYAVTGNRRALERGDLSGVHRQRQLADPYLGQLPEAFEAHLLPTLYAAVLSAAERYRGRGQGEFQVSVSLDLAREP